MFGSGRNARGQADLFESIFGSAFGGGPHPGGRPRESVSRGEDIETSIGISFIDACKGTSRTVNVTPVVDCHTCTGTGLKKGAKRSTCATCHGTGTRTFTIDSGFQMASTCQTCHGTGSMVPQGSQCDPCGGIGKIKERKTVKVDIPAGK